MGENHWSNTPIFLYFSELAHNDHSFEGQNFQFSHNVVELFSEEKCKNIRFPSFSLRSDGWAGKVKVNICFANNFYRRPAGRKVRCNLPKV